ncbi:ATP-binding protein [Bacteroides sp.]
MERLFATSHQLIERVSMNFVRYLYHEIRWENRLIAITGARGTGKTTLMLQYIKKHYGAYSSNVLYASLDHIWFTTHSLFDLADEFQKMGGKVLFLDEVHKYPTWSREIKNIYDSFPDMKVVFTGSSLLEIHKGEADLSRRAVTYHLHGLSFREFLLFEYDHQMEAVSLSDILAKHVEIAMSVSKTIKPLVAFKEYLSFGYFPFYKEDKALYHERLLATLNTILDVDLPATESIDYYSIGRIKKLFVILSQLVPCIPNISALSKELEVTRISLLNYLWYLQKAQTLLLLDKEAFGIKQLAKPEKIYLGNTNYAYALGGEKTDIGNVRETFFFNQTIVKHKVTYSSQVDFLLDEAYHFEIGGKNKTKKQLEGIANGYLAVDNIELGFGNQIPLWLFGLMY